MPGENLAFLAMPLSLLTISCYREDLKGRPEELPSLIARPSILYQVKMKRERFLCIPRDISRDSRDAVYIHLRVKQVEASRRTMNEGNPKQSRVEEPFKPRRDEKLRTIGRCWKERFSSAVTAK